MRNLSITVVHFGTILLLFVNSKKQKEPTINGSTSRVEAVFLNNETATNARGRTRKVSSEFFYSFVRSFIHSFFSL